MMTEIAPLIVDVLEAHARAMTVKQIGYQLEKTHGVRPAGQRIRSTLVELNRSGVTRTTYCGSSGYEYGLTSMICRRCEHHDNPHCSVTSIGQWLDPACDMVCPSYKKRRVY